MKFYIVSDSFDGKEDIQGMYYLIDDKGQYIDNIMSRNMENAYDQLVKKHRQRFIDRFGEPCDFLLLKNANISVWELRVLTRTLKKRSFDRYGNPIPLKEAEPIVIEKKGKKRGRKKDTRKYCKDVLNLKKLMKKKSGINLFRRMRYQKQFEKKGEKDGTIQEVSTE